MTDYQVEERTTLLMLGAFAFMAGVFWVGVLGGCVWGIVAAVGRFL